MFAIAFILRLAYILVAHTYKFKPYDHDFSFGWEMGRIGRAIANGRFGASRVVPAARPKGPL